MELKKMFLSSPRENFTRSQSSFWLYIFVLYDWNDFFELRLHSIILLLGGILKYLPELNIKLQHQAKMYYL